MSFIQLPVELVEEILKHTFEARDISRGMRLRLINRTFSRLVVQVIFAKNLLDPYLESSTLFNQCHLPPFAGKYLKHRVMNEPRHGRPTLNLIRDVAASLSQASSDRRTTMDFADQLCQYLADNQVHDIARFWGDSIPYGEIFKDHLYMAALLTKTTPLIDELITSGTMESVQSGVFGTARNYAAQHGEHFMIKAVMESCSVYDIPHMRRSMLQSGAEAGSIDIVRQVWNSATDEKPWEFVRGGRTCDAKLNESRLRSIDTSSKDVFEFLMDKRRIHCTTREFGAKEYTKFLNRCATKGWTEMAAHYLDLGADVNGFGPEAYDDGRDIPLINACKKGFEAIVELLLARGADTSNPVLESAAEQGNLSIVRKLLDYGAEFGEALLAAAAKGWGDIVQELLDRGALVGSHLQALLLSAIEQEHTSMFKLVVQRNGNIIDPVTMSECRRVAVEKGLESMAQLVLDVKCSKQD